MTAEATNDEAFYAAVRKAFEERGTYPTAILGDTAWDARENRWRIEGDMPNLRVTKWT